MTPPIPPVATRSLAPQTFAPGTPMASQSQRPATPAPLPTLTAPPTSPAPDAAGWLVYQSWDGATHLRLRSSDSLVDRYLVDGSHPDWSPDGKQIAYEVDSQDIWIINADGSSPQKVFDCLEPCILGDSPAWSPDGRWIAFTTADDVNGQAPIASIFAVDVASGKVRTLVETRGPEYPFYPRWSPDGNWIVLSIQRFATTSVDDCSPIGSAVAVVDLTAAKAIPRALTEFSMFSDYPDWSPDGSHIVFTTHDLGTRDFGCAIDPSPPSDLYTIRPDGTELKQLTHNAHGTKLTRPVRPAAHPDAAARGTASGPLSAQPT
jgi:Tol biopolymer transport system component